MTGIIAEPILNFASINYLLDFIARFNKTKRRIVRIPTFFLEHQKLWEAYFRVLVRLTPRYAFCDLVPNTAASILISIQA